MSMCSKTCNIWLFFTIARSINLAHFISRVIKIDSFHLAIQFVIGALRIDTLVMHKNSTEMTNVTNFPKIWFI